MKKFRLYKDKKYYYINYTSQDFVKLNPRYSIGVTILELKVDAGMFLLTKIIEGGFGYTHDRFFPNTSLCVIGWDKRDVVEQIFTKSWFRE